MFMPISSSPHGGGPRPGGGNIFSSGGGGGSNQHSSCSPIPTPRFVTKPMMSDVIRYVQLFRYGESCILSKFHGEKVLTNFLVKIKHSVFECVLEFSRLKILWP